MSSEPVPRMPDVCQVSMNSTSAGREEAHPLRVVVAHRATDDPIAVLGAAPPLPPSCDAVAIAYANAASVRREDAAVAVPGDVKILRATSGATNAASDDVVEAIPAHHPAEPSPWRPRDRIDHVDRARRRGHRTPSAGTA